jgi:hypothetical protein
MYQWPFVNKRKEYRLGLHARQSTSKRTTSFTSRNLLRGFTRTRPCFSCRIAPQKLTGIYPLFLLPPNGLNKEVIYSINQTDLNLQADGYVIALNRYCMRILK